MVKFYSYSRTDKAYEAPADPVPAAPQPSQVSNQSKSGASGADAPRATSRKRFESAQKKMKKLKVSIASKLDSQNLLPYSFSDDQMGSFFADELENGNNSDSSDFWRRFYKAVQPKGQSLPLVLLNHRTLFAALRPIILDDATAILGLSMLHGLIRDVRQEVFEDMIASGLDTLSQVMVTHEAIFEKSMVVLAAFVRNCFKKIVQNLDGFVQKSFEICFGSVQAKQVARVFAEVLAFLWRRTEDDSIRQQMVTLVFQKAVRAADHPHKQVRKNLVYFLACFKFEVLKGVGRHLHERHENTLEHILEVVRDQMDVIWGSEARFDARHVFADVFLRSWRVLNYRFMKAEARTQHSEKISNLPRFVHLVKRLSRENGPTRPICQSITATLISDRLLFRGAICFDKDFGGLAVEALRDSDNGWPEKVIIAAHFLVRADASQLESVLTGLTSVKSLFDVLNEIVFLEGTDRQVETLIAEGYILTPDRPVPHSLLTPSHFKTLVNRAAHFIHVCVPEEALTVCQLGLLLRRLMEAGGIVPSHLSPQQFSSQKLGMVFRQAEDIPTRLGSLFLLSLSKIENQTEFFEGFSGELLQDAQRITSEFEFLRLETFDYARLSERQRVALFDSEHDGNWKPQALYLAELVGLTDRLSNSTLQEKNSKGKKESVLGRLRAVLRKEGLVDPAILGSLLNSDVLGGVQGPEIWNNIMWGLLNRHSGIRLSLLRALQTSKAAASFIDSQSLAQLLPTLIEVT